MPLLAVFGEKDRQVPAVLNGEALRRVRPEADIVQLPGLNHLFQTAGTGLPAEHATIEETVSPSALTLVADWIERVTAR